MHVWRPVNGSAHRYSDSLRASHAWSSHHFNRSHKTNGWQAALSVIKTAIYKPKVTEKAWETFKPFAVKAFSHSVSHAQNALSPFTGALRPDTCSTRKWCMLPSGWIIASHWDSRLFAPQELFLVSFLWSFYMYPTWLSNHNHTVHYGSTWLMYSICAAACVGCVGIRCQVVKGTPGFKDNGAAKFTGSKTFKSWGSIRWGP